MQVCGAAWSFERVMDHSMDSNPITRAQRDSRSDCMELCLNDNNCRYVRLHSATVIIILSETVDPREDVKLEDT